MPSITVWKCVSGQAVGRHHRLQGEGHRVLRRAREHGADLAAPPGELRAGEVRIGRLVDDIVDFAAERVERGDRAPPLRRQEHEAVVEARAALRGSLLAILVGRHATPPGWATRWRRGGNIASRATRAQSVRESFGRRRKTSPPVASIPSRMRWPPAMTPDNSRPSRHGQCAGERASGLEHGARARRFEGEERPPRIVAPRGGDVAFGDAEAREIRAGQVHPALLPIDGDVLPEIDELECRADRVACSGSSPSTPLRRGEASAGRPGWRNGGSNRAGLRRSRSASSGRPAGTRTGGRETAPATDRGVRSRPRAREMAARRKGRQPRSHRARVRSGRAPPGGPRGEVAFVRKVVGGARKRVDGADGGPQPLRHEPRRDRKVFVMSDGHAKSGALRRKHTISSGKSRPPRGVFLASRP